MNEEILKLLDQLRKYAEDFSKIYKLEKMKSSELKTLKKQLKNYAFDLRETADRLKIANKDINNAYIDTINRLSIAAEFRDDDTGFHISRISRYCILIAEKLGMSKSEIENIQHASPMHDVGKIGIPDSILLKKGKLTKEEFETMKTHTTIGARILGGSRSEILWLAQRIAATHHEKWDGSGYPKGLSKEDIPPVGMIVGLADTFDALTSLRPYKKPYPIDVVLEIIKKERGYHFSPEVADVFLENIDRFIEIKVFIDNEEIKTFEFEWSERDVEMVFQNSSIL